MKPWKWIVISVAIIGLVLFIQIDANAQCAICQAVATNSADQRGYASGINKGIIYLMGAPYLLMALLGFVFFRKRIIHFVKDFNEIHQ